MKWHLPYPLSQFKKQREEEEKAKRANQSKKPGNANRNSKLGVSVKGPQGKRNQSNSWQQQKQRPLRRQQQPARSPAPPRQPPQLPQQQHPPGSMSWAAVAAAPGLNREQLANMRRPSPPALPPMSLTAEEEQFVPHAPAL